MYRYFVEYSSSNVPVRIARAGEDAPQSSIDELLSRGFVEVTKEEYDRCDAILFPPAPTPEPITLEQVVQRVEVVEDDMDSVKRGILDLSMQIPAVQ